MCLLPLHQGGYINYAESKNKTSGDGDGSLCGIKPVRTSHVQQPCALVEGEQSMSSDDDGEREKQ